MGDDVSGVWEFETDRLAAGLWHDVADRLGVDLGEVVAGLLTPRTTVSLPTAWRGDYSVESARGWIHDRDADSSMMLVVEVALRAPVGLLLLAEVALPDTGVDLRIGYLFAESAWGRGLATELVSGVTAWARTRPGIRTLTGGVDPANRASARVLEKCGFGPIGDSAADGASYRLDISASIDRDR